MFETVERNLQPQVCVARPIDGITINEQVEYLLDDAGSVIEFPSLEVAEAYLMAHGVSKEEMRTFFFEEIPEQ